jgi:DNA-binding LytR/AlgR family response regulator
MDRSERESRILAEHSGGADRPERIQATVGNTLRFFAVSEICYCRADSKYTRVVTRDTEALIRRSVSALCASFDSDRFRGM